MTTILSLTLRLIRAIVRALRAVERRISARVHKRLDLDVDGRATISELTPGDCVEHGCAHSWGGCIRCGSGAWDPSRLTLKQLPPFLRSQIILKIRATRMLLVDVGDPWQTPEITRRAKEKATP